MQQCEWDRYADFHFYFDCGILTRFSAYHFEWKRPDASMPALPAAFRFSGLRRIIERPRFYLNPPHGQNERKHSMFTEKTVQRRNCPTLILHPAKLHGERTEHIPSANHVRVICTGSRSKPNGFAEMAFHRASLTVCSKIEGGSVL